MAIEDFYPKRKVIDGSKRRGNVVGFFVSRKMGYAVQYQSKAECNLLYDLELDTSVKEYYVQPVNIPVIVRNGESWSYVPDVLAFYYDGTAILFEVKYKNEKTIEIQQLIREKAAKVYCRKKNWEYKLVYMSEYPSIYVENLNFFIQHIYPRADFEKYKDEIILTVGLNEVPINTIAETVSIKCQVDKRVILTHIFHLIAIGELKINMFKPVDIDSKIYAFEVIKKG